MDAADEDRATAGFDMARQIYPTCRTIPPDGVGDASDEEILAARERVLARMKED